MTIAILGDLAPLSTGDAHAKYLESAVAQLNVLRPDLVFTIGNLVPGLTRNGERYMQQVRQTRAMLDPLKMPWYPCAGETDVVSGTRMANAGGGADRRFEELYQAYFGPLYYSVDAGDVHTIVLDSEEGVGSGAAISEAQLQWLKGDLDRVFNGLGRPEGRVPWVIVILHRPLWRIDAPGWKRVHDLLVEFNRRPIVSIEGVGAGAGSMVGEARGPRVAAVFAGSRRAYSLEPTEDGIRYFLVGPTAAQPRLGEDAAETLRHITLVKFDRTGPQGNSAWHAALLKVGNEGRGADAARAILAEDFVTARERAAIDAIASWDNRVIGVEGIIDTRGQPIGNNLRLVFNNPLPEPIDIQLALAGSRSRNELSNPAAEGLDLPWVFNSPHQIRHIEAGERDAFEVVINRPEGWTEGSGQMAPPQMEFVVRWSDARARSHEVVLKRRVTVAPTLPVPVTTADAVALDGEGGWNQASGSSAFCWNIRGDEPQKINPTFDITADRERIHVRVRVADAIHSYWPRLALDKAWGGLASDAVNVAWIKGSAEKPTVQRVWVLPFGPANELWTNAGTGDSQTPLVRLDPRLGVKSSVKADDSGYTVTLSFPRDLLCDSTIPPPASLPAKVTGVACINITVLDNDETARTWQRSWANEEAGFDAWGRIDLVEPPPAAGR